jgi:hypothetical protein
MMDIVPALSFMVLVFLSGIGSLLWPLFLLLLLLRLLRLLRTYQKSLEDEKDARFLVGLAGEVCERVPSDGVGRIRVNFRGVERYFPAKCAKGQEIEAFQWVRVTSVEQAPKGEALRLIVEVLARMPTE